METLELAIEAFDITVQQTASFLVGAFCALAFTIAASIKL